MNFLAVLDFEHLDNGLFLTSFARALAQIKERGIIIHGDSEYTDRIIQTGVMREDARLRAMKDLNHRLTALFADEGISTISVNGYQKSLVRYENREISISRSQLDRFPVQPMLLISALAEVPGSRVPAPLPLADFALSMQREMSTGPITIFSKDDSSTVIKGDFPKELIPSEADPKLHEKHIPASFKQFSQKVLLTTPEEFRKNNY
jgi:hypothetical protein